MPHSSRAEINSSHGYYASKYNVYVDAAADVSLPQRYLSDGDFHMAFKMDRDTFYLLPAWKQINLKKQANLF